MGGWRYVGSALQQKKAVNRAERVRVIQTYNCGSRRSESLVQITPQVYSCMCHSSQTVLFALYSASCFPRENSAFRDGIRLRARKAFALRLCYAAERRMCPGAFGMHFAFWEDGWDEGWLKRMRSSPTTARTSATRVERLETANACPASLAQR